MRASLATQPRPPRWLERGAWRAHARASPAPRPRIGQPTTRAALAPARDTATAAQPGPTPLHTIPLHASWSWPALATLAATLAHPLAAFAEETVAYDPASGSDFLKNVAGAAYVVLLVVFAARLLRKRATTATSQRFASTVDAQERLAAVGRAAPRSTVKATPGRAALGALQAGIVAALLYTLCVRIDAFFDGAGLPDGYTQRNIAVTLRTISRGLSYLLTFIYAANAVGLGGLAVQLLFYPDDEEEVEGSDDEGNDGVASSPPPPPP